MPSKEMEAEEAQERSLPSSMPLKVTLNGYQQAAMMTAIYPGRMLSTTFGDPKRSLQEEIIARCYVGLKLTGEAGEVTELLGKALRDDNGIITHERREKLKLELGDVLWYVAALASELGFKLSEISDSNLEKLARRKAEGKLKGSGSDR